MYLRRTPVATRNINVCSCSSSRCVRNTSYPMSSHANRFQCMVEHETTCDNSGADICAERDARASANYEVIVL